MRCPRCDGEGSLEHGDCHGQGCSICGGQGCVDCHACHGSGTMDEARALELIACVDQAGLDRALCEHARKLPMAPESFALLRAIGGLYGPMHYL